MEKAKTVLHLSQSNLQDFSECPRRFELKVIDNISWPAAYLEPLSQLEQATEIGNKFHQLCHQYFTGIDQDSLNRSISNPDLKIMWESFSTFAKGLQDENRFPEIILSTPFLGHQLIAKYDLVLKTNNGKFIIYDWKTSTQKPTRTLISQRFQTFLYPYILVKTGNSIFKKEQPSPKNISMNYWYPMSSDPEEIFPYSDTLYSENTDQLTEIISEIDGYVNSGKIFPMTIDRKLCGKCVYRSLCERGIQAGKFDPITEIDGEDLSGVHFDLDNISEIEF
jgi:CRISPR/Cas system-associated exonuclease Cas4 (RecB family)